MSAVIDQHTPIYSTLDAIEIRKRVQATTRLDLLQAELDELRRSHVHCERCNARLQRIKAQVAQMTAQPSEDVGACYQCGETTPGKDGDNWLCADCRDTMAKIGF